MDKKIIISQKRVTEGSCLLQQEDNSALLRLPAEGGGILLPELVDCRERYLTFFLTVQEEHSTSFHLRIFSKKDGEKERRVDGEEAPVFTVRFGLLGGVRALICLDLSWMDAHILFPEASIGEQKVVCHGRRVEREEIGRVELAVLPCFHDIKVSMEKLVLTDNYPSEFPIPEEILVDEFGQNKRKEWNGKIHSLRQLQEALQRQFSEAEQVLESGQEYPFSDWTAYGGWKRKKLAAGSGFFSRYKENGRWWLVDPDGYAFFSAGVDCVGVNGDCRVDGVEKCLDWLPEREDPVYRDCFQVKGKPVSGGQRRRECVLFSYGQANLYRAFGSDWYEKWKSMITSQLKGYGFNTLGNWSDSRLFGTAKFPYVTSLPEFPGTHQFIFRDFPDVFSKEYEENAKRCAQLLSARKEDPFMIGYFLRNEPSWAFVDNLILADEVLYNPAKTACKEALIRFLKEKYQEPSKLSEAWNRQLSEFEELYQVQKKVSSWSEQANADMREFSRKMLAAYIGIPSRACRQVDPNHMILGMRWAWISDPDLVTGWENFDVFSINCYAVDPTKAIQNVVDRNVDLPVMIGEFHFGALDAGPTATGLEGVRTQRDRGIAYRYYCERVAAHPNGVGCHYFQFYDQFVLGRFDGENYNIGLFDICSRPYPEMMEQVKECSRSLYEVADGQKNPVEKKAESIPMIAY